MSETEHTCHIDLVEFSKANARRCNESFHTLDDWSISDWAVAAAGELGEACNLIKKLKRDGGISYNDIAEELADCVTYIDLLLTKMNKELAYELIAKFNKVSRKVNSPEHLVGNKG